jgi:prepilin-type processing-associated H-X9-DG protein
MRLDDVLDDMPQDEEPQDENSQDKEMQNEETGQVQAVARSDEAFSSVATSNKAFSNEATTDGSAENAPPQMETSTHRDGEESVHSLPLEPVLTVRRASLPPTFSPRTSSSPVPPSPVSSKPLPSLVTVPPDVTGLWADLPAINRFLALSGGLCLLLAASCLALPQVAEATRSAVHPYTAAGKGENCLANLGALHQALGLYARDNDELYPPLDYTANASASAATAGEVKAVQRVTWVSFIGERGGNSHLQCPAGPGIGGAQQRLVQQGLVSSYALNPVLSLARSGDVDKPGQTLLLADGGAKHDVSLLPPYPSWPSFAHRTVAMQAVAHQPEAATGSLSNLGLRHDGNAGALYADGHAALFAGGEGEKAAELWGGSAVLRRSLARLAGQNEEAKALVAHLKAGKNEAAAGLLRVHRRKLLPVRDGIATLWHLSTGESASQSVTEAGWNLARASAAAGDGTITKQLNAEESRRSQAELERTQKAGWETETTSWGISVQKPAAWTLEEESEGRYKRIYLRSGLRTDVFVLLETGEHRRYRTPQPIDWRGMEDDLRRRYGKSGYKRVRMMPGTLNGQAASLWEYEIEKAGSPRLRKRYLGYSDGWQSHVVGMTAPAWDFQSWTPVFDRF